MRRLSCWRASSAAARRMRGSTTSCDFKFQLNSIFRGPLTSDESKLIDELRRTIRDVNNFPKPGIVFKDVTPVLLEAKLFARTVTLMAEPYRDARITRVVSIESRGFLFGAPIALELEAGLVPIRKPGKLPSATQRVEYALEYGTDALEMHHDAVQAGDRVLVVDDVLATGGTANAAAQLVGGTGAAVVGFSFLIELDFLKGRQRLQGRRVEALLHYT
jgi:adenine phosphoribosyltransferase